MLIICVDFDNAITCSEKVDSSTNISRSNILSKMKHSLYMEFDEIFVINESGNMAEYFTECREDMERINTW